jgi:transposase-like protein
MAKHFTTEFKAQIVKEAKEVGNIAMVARKNNISSKNIYNWVNSANKKISDPSRAENKKLKKELAEAKLELMILKDLLKKTYKN